MKLQVNGKAVESISFNTGNPYTANGQRLTFARIDCGIAMVDVDRGINGVWLCDDEMAELFWTASNLKSAYDANKFSVYLGRYDESGELRPAMEQAARLTR